MNKKENHLKPDDNYLGIPRKEIPWYPSIDYEKCDSCKTCVDYCRLQTYAYNKKDGRVEVLNPYNCVVSCNGCEDKCPEGAITFPSTGVIDEVRKRYRV